MGLPEKAAKGLHAAAFELFRKHVRPALKFWIWAAARALGLRGF
jgi:hypothetical protein